MNFDVSLLWPHCHELLPFLVPVDFSSGLEGGLAEVAIEVLHLLLSHLLERPEEEVGVNSEAIETFVRTMRQDFPRERVPVVLAPLLCREQQDITEDRWSVFTLGIDMFMHMCSHDYQNNYDVIIDGDVWEISKWNICAK